jgi:Zn-dependent protease with chaperone function
LIGALCMALIVGAARSADASGEAAALAAESHQVQELVDAMRLELSLSHEVSVELVTANPLKASVEPVKGADGTFRLSLERSFLEQLTRVELRAVIAHELGHVWIYTHHPYLQTEQLANSIALRVVSRESLDSVYGKVWPDAAGRGSLPRFPEARTADLGGADPQN